MIGLRPGRVDGCAVHAVIVSSEIIPYEIGADTEYRQPVMAPLRDTLGGAAAQHVEQSLRDFDAWLDHHIERLRREPGDDLMSKLVAARDETGAPLPDDELLGSLAFSNGVVGTRHRPR